MPYGLAPLSDLSQDDDFVYEAALNADRTRSRSRLRAAICDQEGNWSVIIRN